MSEPNIDKKRREQYSTKVEENLPKILTFPKFKKTLSLRYGINPGGPAAFYSEQGATGPNMGNFTILQEGSKGLGYINVGDMDVGQGLVKLLHDDYPGMAAYCIIKHEMPSGVGIGQDMKTAYENSGGDPLSSFGGVHVCSQEVDDVIATELIDKFKNVEVIYAPSFSSSSLEILSQREPLRVVQMRDINQDSIDNGLEYKRVKGGMLVQPYWETRIHIASDLECVSKKQPTDDEVKAALFNWKVAGFTRSNAVVIGTEERTHGIGSGQRSRIDSAYNSIRFANGRDGTNPSFGAEGTFMASDAYMPSTDVAELAAKSGVKGIIFPLGSIADKKVIEVANEKGLILLATRKPGEDSCERCFTHR